MPIDTPKTKKMAREIGLRTVKELFSKGYVPLVDASGYDVKGERFFAESDCEELISKTEASRRDLKVEPSAVPIGQKYYKSRGIHYDVFRVSDCIPKQKKKEIPPVEIDILLATFTVNKAAKRYRDAASKFYDSKMHGFAGNSSDKKEYLYYLKDKGILAAIRAGKLAFVALHGRLAIYRGEGYCFHSTLVPKESELRENVADLQIIFIESSPKEASEARLKDAIMTLSNLPDDETGFERLASPARGKKTYDEDEDEDCSDNIDYPENVVALRP